MATFTALIIDDDPDDRLLTIEALMNSGNFTECLELDRPSKLFPYLEMASILPCVMLLDLNMPGESGFQVLEKLKNHPSYCSIPVVIFSTSRSAQDAEKALELGAETYITKPSDSQGFLDLPVKLNNILSEIETHQN